MEKNYKEKLTKAKIDLLKRLIRGLNLWQDLTRKKILKHKLKVSGMKTGEY